MVVNISETGLKKLLCTAILISVCHKPGRPWAGYLQLQSDFILVVRFAVSFGLYKGAAAVSAAC